MSKRVSEYSINNLFLNRWSPRAMSGEVLTHNELMSLFEAAKWAPSSYNNQPWRFIYATRDSQHWQKFFDLLVPFNQSWCNNAAALVVVAGHKLFEFNGKPSRTFAFDAGAAWANLALQASLSGLIAHGMEGFDYARAQQELGIPADYEVLAMIALGKPGRKEDLPAELQEREEPSDRKPLADIVFEGSLGGKK
ncbi:nitroreductase family protein [Candidatus Babeliales bacterium]|nr:nitroreductase family protein [Candidatus Babeliales bacterium]